MPKAACSDDDFVELFEKHGAHETARILDVGIRNIYDRRARLEKKIGRQITGPSHHARTRNDVQHPHRINLELENGVILVGGDAHYWPNIVTTAHKAFVKFAKEMDAKVVILNGDMLDGASISRHPPIGWEARPSLIQEIEVVKERLDEIRDAAPNAKKVWNLGNHDGRFETRLATVAPEYAKIHGVHLKDHFPEWWPAWSTWINDDVVVKHRFKGGVHAAHNNTLWAGKSIVTNHLHSGKVTPFTDYNGTRWGVDTGTLAEPGGPQFVDYMEDNPANWRSSFGVLTFYKGRLLTPELVYASGPGQVDFRGQVIEV